MESIEYDVYLSYRAQSGTDLARLMAAGLTRRGFRVYAADEAAGAASPDEAWRAIIEDTPDFVLLLTPQCLDRCGDEHDRMRLEIAHALTSGRNVVAVTAPGFVRPEDNALPPDIASFDSRHSVAYVPRSSDESIAAVTHRLSSDATVDERDMLRQAKWIGSGVGLVLLALIAVAIASLVPKLFGPRLDLRPLPPLALYWSGFGQRLDAGRWVEFPVQNEGRVTGGDRIQMVFSASADGFAYVLGRTVAGEVEVLFPSTSRAAADSHVRAGHVYQAPADGSWFSLDGQRGIEALYIVVSYDPIDNLEALVEERDAESTAQAGRALLETTIDGLLDGRHASTGARVRTRRGRPIVESNIEVPPARLTASTTLAGGARVTHALIEQPGLLSAMSEIHVRYEPVAR
jgi:hypothetical protein